VQWRSIDLDFHNKLRGGQEQTRCGQEDQAEENTISDEGIG